MKQSDFWVMIKIAILGEIGSGKSFVAKNFGHPVFNADLEVSKLYKKDKKVFNRLNKTLPKYINSFPIDKKQIVTAILKNNKNLNKIIRIIHKEIRKKLKLFLKRNKNKKFVILDIPLFLENKIDSNKDILIYVKSKKKDIVKRLTKRKDFNKKIYDKFKKIQLKGDYKKKKSHFIINNKFTKDSVKKEIISILNKIN